MTAKRELLAMLLAACAACAAPTGASERLSDERRDELAARWRLYLADDAKWPQAREEWLAGPEHEKELLLDNLLIELLRDDAAGRGSATSARSTRARREIVWFGADALPILVEAMRTLCAREPADPIAIDRVGQALVELRATKELVELSIPAPGTQAEDPSRRLRYAAVRSLATVAEPAATAAIADRLCGDPAWQVRGVAADVLRKRIGEPQARAALLQALTDADGYVRSQAVRALVIGVDPEEDAGTLDRVFAFLLQDPAAEARAAAAEALELLAYDARVQQALVAALRDPDPDVVKCAALSLTNAPTTPVRLALIDALERAMRQRQEGLVSELLVVLHANVGSKPKDINPAGWRAHLQQAGGER